MKNKFIALVLFLSAGTLLFNSCSDDVLDQGNTNTVAPDNFWNNASDAKLAVNGMYHPITNTFFWGRIVHTGAILRSDVFNVRPFGPNTAMSTFQGAPGAARWATEIWQEPFKSVARANAILENVNATNVPDDDDRNAILGQAYFMRGFSNWYLLNLFGNIPLVTETVKSSEDFEKPAASQEAVWTQIEADFQAAEDALPLTWSGGDIGRPTKGAATAFLGKSHLYQGSWGEAETAFRKVIGYGIYDLLPTADFAENFTEANENNVESIFELQYLGISNFAWGVDIPGVGTMGNFHIDYAPPSKSPDLSHYVNSWVRQLFEANGETVRRDATLAYDYPGATGYGGTDFLTDFEPDILLARGDNVDSVFTRKYAGLDIGTRDEVDFLGTNVGTNWRIIRYADVLLMLAEALNEQGGQAKIDEGIGLVNQVRTRATVATMATGMSQGDFRQAIIDERVLELTGEGHRFFDLVRWGLADDYMGTTSIHGDHPKSLSGGIFVENKHEYLWIPELELTANPNLQQNPGY